MSNEQVTVIIPTLCNRERSFELNRAIESVRKQQNINVAIIVVVNGNKADLSLLATIKGLRDVVVLQIEQPNVSIARYTGLLHSSTPYFLFLDDDDELYPNAIERMLAKFNSSEHEIGLVISDAYNEGYNRNIGFISDPAIIESCPLEALVTENWLVIQATLFKRAIVPDNLFDLEAKYNECTLLAFKIALSNIKISILNEPLVRIHNTPNSASKSNDFLVSDIEIINFILSMNLPDLIRKKMRRKLANAYHNISVYYLDNNKIMPSFITHLQSLIYPGGRQYLSYTRHIFLKAIKLLSAG